MKSKLKWIVRWEECKACSCVFWRDNRINIQMKKSQFARGNLIESYSTTLLNDKQIHLSKRNVFLSLFLVIGSFIFITRTLYIRNNRIHYSDYFCIGQIHSRRIALTLVSISFCSPQNRISALKVKFIQWQPQLVPGSQSNHICRKKDLILVIR